MPTAIAAFGGWNDAGSAATDAVRHFADAFGAETVAAIPPDDYCDLQVTRPVIRWDSAHERQIVWPSTDVMVAHLPDETELITVLGIEPSFRWLNFVDELLIHLQDLEVDRLWLIGALLADVPHTRPFKVQLTSETPALCAEFGAEPSSYEGPAGIVSVLGHEVWTTHGVPTGALWVPVSHYVPNSPSPKAQLALITKMAELLGIEAPDTAQLDDDAATWTAGVDRLAASDPEIAGYVANLEAASDALDAPSSSGEAIAKEFERYLRRHGS
ncbi:MAG: PAC2 family protein [Bifidobacteriaceae bacterium]|nr:PAC2 family protein [Bifidobacteriaceae bacterium]